MGFHLVLLLISDSFFYGTDLGWNGRVVEEEGDVGRAEWILNGDDVHEGLGHVQPAGLGFGQLVQVHHCLRRILLTENVTRLVTPYITTSCTQIAWHGNDNVKDSFVCRNKKARDVVK